MSTATTTSGAPAGAVRSAAQSAGAAAERVVILNQYYVPDVASTGHLLHELATELVEQGFDVRVVTTRPSYGPKTTWQPVKLRDTHDGVQVRRLLTTRFNKDNIVGRLVNSVTFMIPMTLRMLLMSRSASVYLYTTNPPFLGVIGAFVSLFRRHRYVVLLHDAYPQIAVWVGTIGKGGFIERTWHAMNRMIYRRAAHTIVLCDAAKRLVCDTYKIDPARVHVIANWADREKLVPIPKAETAMARRHGFVEPFTALYSGNLGLYYEFETILNAAKLLEDENFKLVFVGSGGRKVWIQEQIRKLGLKNAVMLPYQPFENLNDSLNACDASLVTIAEGIEGISFPSKLYSSLAVGKPILAMTEDWSEVKSLVEERRVGVWSAIGDPEAMAAGIRTLMRDPGVAAEMGRRARELFEERYTREASGRRYADVFRRAAADGIETPARTGAGG